MIAPSRNENLTRKKLAGGATIIVDEIYWHRK
jgi:hypothetical protein